MIIIKSVQMHYEIFLITHTDTITKHSICGQFPTTFDAIIALKAYSYVFGEENVYLHGITETGRNMFGDNPRSAGFINAATTISPDAERILATKREGV